MIRCSPGSACGSGSPSFRRSAEDYTVGLIWTLPGSAAGAGGSPVRSRDAAVQFSISHVAPLGSAAKGYGLAYGVTRMAEHDRLWHRMEKIARRLGDADPDPEIPPRKPKWMRSVTYDRLLESWHEAGSAGKSMEHLSDRVRDPKRRRGKGHADRPCGHGVG
jgi:hypothetical protein